MKLQYIAVKSKYAAREIMKTGGFKLTYKDLENLCSPKNSFLHTRSYTTASISSEEKKNIFI